MTNNINPWDLFLNDTPLDNEIAYRSLFAFTSAKRASDTLYRIKEKNLKDSDFEMRDIIFTGQRREEMEHPSLFYYSKQHYKGTKTFDSAVKYNEVMKECVRKKYFFWKKYTSFRPETKEKEESRNLISQAVKSFKLPSQILFTLSGVGIAYYMGLQKNILSHRVVAVLIGVFVGTMYGEFKHSTDIYDAIPPLPDKEIEQERQDIYNYCFSLDVKQIADALVREQYVKNDEPAKVEQPKK